MYHFSSIAQSCLTLCDPMDCTMPGLPVHHELWSLLKLISIESVMPSNHLILCRPLLLLPSIFPSIRVFSNESVLCIRWPKYWFQHQSFQTIFRVEAQIYQKERPVQPLVWQRQRTTRRRMCGRGSRLCSVQLTGMGTGSATVGVL